MHIDNFLKVNRRDYSSKQDDGHNNRKNDDCLAPKVENHQLVFRARHLVFVIVLSQPRMWSPLM